MFDELQKLDIKEIVSRTHLDEAVIKAIITRDFEKLKNTNINMNLKILNREFGIDFSEWLEDFNNYKKNNFCDNEKFLKVKPKIMTYQNQEGNGNYFSYLFFVFVFVLIILGGIFYYYNYIEDVESKQNIEETPALIIQPKPEIKKEELKETIEEKLPKIEEIQEETPKEIKETKETEIVEEKIQNETSAIEQKQQSESKEEVQEVQEEKHKIKLKPSSKSWVSVKDLKTKETKNYMLEKAISFDEDVLIFIGKTDYTIDLDGKEIVPNKNDSRYILFKDGKVEFLTQDKYKKLDRAK